MTRQALGAYLAGLTVWLASAGAWAQQTEGASAPGSDEGAVPEAAPAHSLDDLLGALRSPDAAERIRAAQALGELGDPAAVPPLISIVRSDPVPEVRGWVVRSLYDLGTPEARAAVVEAARNDPDERVRTMAARLAGVRATQPTPSPFSTPPQTPQPAPMTFQPQPQPVAAPTIHYQRRSDPGRRLRLAGWIITGVSYGLALLTGIAMLAADDEYDEYYDYDDTDYTDWGWKMLLPLVGPAVAATTNRDTTDDGVISMCWIWSLIQATGVVLLSVGYARRASHRGESEESRERSDTFGVAMLPGGPGGPAGLTFSGYW